LTTPFPELPPLADPADSLFPAQRRLRLARCGSTNDEVRDRIRAGEPEGLLVLADRQDAGRGRLGRAWHSPPGRNIHLTLLLRPALAPERVPLVTLALALAGRVALRRAGVRARIKWPNDLVVRTAADRPLRKLAGIACEAVASGAGGLALAAGIGINVDLTADELPVDIAATATSVRIETGLPGDRASIVARLLESFAPLYLMLAEDGGVSLLSAYRDALDTLGREVRVDLGDRVAVGTAVGVGGRGQLRVRGEDGVVEEILAGDVGF
jgi:BirA family transcriptional regulator, biotin operon repressor / biotin---[acetyl-CoA-carboxylase] ligase